jgi:hypothetical protein
VHASRSRTRNALPKRCASGLVSEGHTDSTAAADDAARVGVAQGSSRCSLPPGTSGASRALSLLCIWQPSSHALPRARCPPLAHVHCINTVTGVCAGHNNSRLVAHSQLALATETRAAGGLCVAVQIALALLAVTLMVTMLLLLEDLYLNRWSQSHVHTAAVREEPTAGHIEEREVSADKTEFQTTVPERLNPLTVISQAELNALIGKRVASTERPPQPAGVKPPAVWDGQVYNFTPTAKHQLDSRRGRMRPTVSGSSQVLWEETVASLYNGTEYQYPFKGIHYREEHDRLLDLPPKMGRPTVDPAALLLTHDDRDWVRWPCSFPLRQATTRRTRRSQHRPRLMHRPARNPTTPCRRPTSRYFGGSRCGTICTPSAIRTFITCGINC